MPSIKTPYVEVKLEEDFTGRLEIERNGKVTVYATGGVRKPGRAPHGKSVPMKLFVSHSSADIKIAEAFVEFLRASLPLAAKDVRCTSVPGYKLPAGTNADQQLKREVFESTAFVVLLSPISIASMYVMFELGARWGTGRYLAPVMVAGLAPSALKAPLSALHAIAATSESDLHELVGDLSGQLKLTPEKPAVYLKALRKFVSAAKPRQRPAPPKASARGRPS